MPSLLRSDLKSAERSDLDYPELRDELAKAGGKLLTEVIPDWLAGKIKPREQDHATATFTKMIEKADGEIKFEDLENKPLETYRKFLAYTPWPGLYFFSNDKRVKITDCILENGVLKIKKVIPARGT